MQPDGPLFAWQPAETPERFKRAKGKPRDYRVETVAFFTARPDVFAWIMQQASYCRAAGHARIEINQIVADARRQFAVSINNSWRAAIADIVCERDPRLCTMIERRRRKATK